MTKTHETETPSRYRKWQQRHNMKSVRITGETHAALTRYKEKHNLSFSVAILELLNEKE